MPGALGYADGRYELPRASARTRRSERAGQRSGAFTLALGAVAAVPAIAEAFRTGAGFGWHEQQLAELGALPTPAGA